MNGELVGEDLLRVSGRLARGIVQRWYPEPAFALRAWNLLFNQPVEFYKPGTEGADKTYTIVFILTPEQCSWQQIGAHRRFTRPNTRSTLLIARYSADGPGDHAAFPVQWIDVNVSAFWPGATVQKANLPLEALWEKLSADNKPIVLIETCNSHEIMLP